MQESHDKYKNCLTRNGGEEIAKRFECDIMNVTYDQYKYRDECWDDDNNWLTSDNFC